MIDDFNSLVIRGARVVLRSVELGDVAGLFGLVSGSREHLERWLPWVEFVRTIDDERHIVEQWIYDMQMKSAIHLGITVDGNLAGLVSTHQIDWLNQRTSVGYWMGLDNVGRNFTTEATALLVTYLFDNLKLHRISIQAATGNEASNRVIRKLGFRWEGLMKENERLKDHFLDHNIYGMTQGDFVKLKERYSRYFKH